MEMVAVPHRYLQSSWQLMNFLRGQAIDVIEWTDDSRDTISFPVSR